MSKKLVKGQLYIDADLKPFTSWRVGGKAERLYWPLDVEDLAAFLKQIPKEEPITWLGLGSNVLIKDGGIAGTVIITQGVLKDMEVLDDHHVRVEAGVSCAQLARFAAKNNLVNGEFFAGIPGTVGGALLMNAGAFGGETWERVDKVEIIDRHGKVHIKTKEAFSCSYRHTEGLGEGEWFLAGYFKLVPGEGKESLAKIKSLLAKRAESQPTGEHSCGSVFKNPQGDFAARLIEAAGLKGKQVGGAHVSQKHANFIINDGDASAEDIITLMNEIQQSVKTQFQIVLKPEVIFLGREACDVSVAPTVLGHVAVLMGGQSAEREISLKSGREIVKALKRQGVQVTAVDVDEAIVNTLIKGQFDRAFIALHGTDGEDGVIQGLLESLGLPYTGSNVASSALCMDKFKAKCVFKALGLPTPAFKRCDTAVDLLSSLDMLSLPICVKPIGQGSSFGISKVTKEEALEKAFALAHEYDEVLAEQWVEGEEYTVGIVDGEVLPVICIRTPREFYDFEAKYVETTTEYLLPSGLDAETEASAQALAQETFKALGCRDWGRVDMIRDQKGKFYLIEVNTIPGMTKTSLLPKAAQHHGWDFDTLVMRVLKGTLAQTQGRFVQQATEAA